MCVANSYWSKSRNALIEMRWSLMAHISISAAMRVANSFGVLATRS